MHRLRELVLWAGAALGLLAVVAGLAVAFGGFSFLVFRSGSMSPEIPTGGVALSRTVDAADIRPGDVVSVTAASGERVTHRVVSTTLRGDEASLVLKGDANEVADSELYVVTSAERVVASAPYGGYVLAHALTPPGLLALASVSMMLILLTTGGPAEAAVDPKPREKPRHRGRVSIARRVVAGSLVIGVAAGTGATVAHTTGTWATFTDKATGSTGSFSSGSVRPATAVNCSATGGAYIRWTAPAPGPAPTGYRVFYTWPTGNSDFEDIGGTTLQYRPPGIFLGTRSYTVTVAALYSTNWVSAVSTTSAVIKANSLGTYSC